MSYNNLRNARESTPYDLYFITTNIIDKKPIFTNIKLGNIVTSELKQLENEKMIFSYAWVIMPNHIHCLFELNEVCQLSWVMQLLKGRTSRKINKILDRRGPLWQRNYYEHKVRSDESIDEIIAYIIENPVRSNLVDDAYEYPLLWSIDTPHEDRS